MHAPSGINRFAVSFPLDWFGTCFLHFRLHLHLHFPNTCSDISTEGACPNQSPGPSFTKFKTFSTMSTLCYTDNRVSNLPWWDEYVCWQKQWIVKLRLYLLWIWIYFIRYRWHERLVVAQADRRWVSGMRRSIRGNNCSLYLIWSSTTVQKKQNSLWQDFRRSTLFTVRHQN